MSGAEERANVERIRQVFVDAMEQPGWEDRGELALFDALVERVAALEGRDWVPTTNIDRTFETMEARGLGPWVESLKAYMGSTGAFYTTEAYREALADVEIQKRRADALSERLKAHEDLLVAVQEAVYGCESEISNERLRRLTVAMERAETQLGLAWKSE